MDYYVKGVGSPPSAVSRRSRRPARRRLPPPARTRRHVGGVRRRGPDRRRAQQKIDARRRLGRIGTGRRPDGGRRRLPPRRRRPARHGDLPRRPRAGRRLHADGLADGDRRLHDRRRPVAGRRAPPRRGSRADTRRSSPAASGGRDAAGRPARSSSSHPNGYRFAPGHVVEARAAPGRRQRRRAATGALEQRPVAVRPAAATCPSSSAGTLAGLVGAFADRFLPAERLTTDFASLRAASDDEQTSRRRKTISPASCSAQSSRATCDELIQVVAGRSRRAGRCTAGQVAKSDLDAPAVAGEAEADALARGASCSARPKLRLELDHRRPSWSRYRPRRQRRTKHAGATHHAERSRDPEDARHAAPRPLGSSSGAEPGWRILGGSSPRRGSQGSLEDRPGRAGRRPGLLERMAGSRRSRPSCLSQCHEPAPKASPPRR